MTPFDPGKAKVSATFKHGGTFYSLCRDSATGQVLAGSDDYGIHVFDPSAEKKEPLARWEKHDNYVSALVRAEHDGKSIAVSGSYDRSLVWWDVEAGKPIRTVEAAHDGWVRGLDVTPDGARLVSVGDDMLVKVWELATGKRVRSLEGHAKRTPQGHVTALYAVAVSPDGKFLASGDRHGEVRVWEAESGKLAARFAVPTLYTYDPRQRKRSIGGIRSLAFSPDGQSLAVGGIGQIGNVDGLGGPIHLEFWDWRKPEARFVTGAKGQRGMVNGLTFHPGGDWLIGGGGGGSGFLAFWKVSSPPEEAKGKKDPVPAHHAKADGHVHAIVFNHDRGEVYAAGYRKLDVWTAGG